MILTTPFMGCSLSMTIMCYQYSCSENTIGTTLMTIGTTDTDDVDGHVQDSDTYIIGAGG